jgi:hypothetical protein
MAKGQYLSGHQKGIVKRYYKNLDTLTLAKLQEAVSDLYLTSKGGGDKAADRKWKSVGEALAKAGVEPAILGKVVAARDVEGLAGLVARLARGDGGGIP